MDFHRMRAIPVAVLFALVAVASASCQAPRDTMDVLYVGNSYVYFNNLPEMVQGISDGLDGPILRGTAHTHGGSTLRGHLEDGHLPGIFSDGPVDGGNWDWVLLHEQSTLGTRYDGDSGVLGSPEAYRSMGTELGVPVAAVGEAWAEVHRVRPEFILHLSDGSHPNAAGSYLAACVIYAEVTGQSPLGAPREITGAPWDFSGQIESAQPTILVSLSPADAEFLQGIAWNIVGPPANGGG